MIHKGRFSIPVHGSVSLSDIRSRTASGLYSKSGDSYTPVHDAVLVSDIPSSVNYNDEAIVNLSIDDRPFNQSVQRCCQQVDALNGDVNTLTTSVVMGATGISAAKAAAAKVISGSLNRGFSRYIKYLIEEKLALLKPKLISDAATLNGIGKQLSDRKSTLENDYNRITSRYTKIFLQLQENLETRLHKLDEIAFDICQSVDSEVFNDPLGVAFGQSVCSGTEQLTAADLVKLATVKNNAVETMRQIESQVISMRQLKKAIQDILSEHAVKDQQRISMPVLRLECDRLETEGADVKVFVPSNFSKGNDGDVNSKISHVFSTIPQIHKSKQESAEVDQYFQKQISSWVAGQENPDPRVLQCIRTMWENNKENLNN